MIKKATDLIFYILKISVITSLIYLINACSGQREEKEIIATVNNENISLNQFRLFYELDPHFGIDSSGINALRDELRFYAFQKLALEKATDDNLLNDPVFKRAVAWEERQAMLRQLFRDQIMIQAVVTEKEIADFYIKQNTKVHLRHLFFPTMEAAIEAKKRLESGVSFKKIAREIFADTMLAENGGDLGWILLGDLEDELAEGIAALNGTGISKPIRSKWGYHIVQLLDLREEKVLREAEFMSQKKSLEKKLRRKKAQELSARYVRQFMSKKNPQPVEPLFRLFWQVIVPYEEREQQQLRTRQMLSAGLLAKVRQILSAELDEALIVYQSGEVTLRNFLDALEEIPKGQRPRFKSMRELSDQMAIWMRDEILYAEARAKGLNSHETVREEVRRFSEEQSYYYYLNEIVDNMQVPDSVEVYFGIKTGISSVTALKWQSFHTLQAWKWNEARKWLWNELSSTRPEFIIDEQLLRAESKRVNWDRRVPMFMLRKPQ